MITDVLPHSPSVLLRAVYVVRIAIAGVQEGPWEKASEGMSRRGVKLSVRVQEVFKGKGKGESLVLELEQYRNDGAVYTPVPGAWSEQKLEKGRELVVAASGITLKAALARPDQVLPAQAASGVQLVAAAEEKRLPAVEVAEQAKGIAKDLDFVFMRWLWERHGERALVDPAAADAVFSLLELPALGDSARATLIAEAVGRCAASPLTYLAGTKRLVRALFQLLAVPEAKGTSENVVGTYLPALIHLDSPPPVPAGALLEDAERKSAHKALAAYSGRMDAAPLKAWLDGP